MNDQTPPDDRPAEPIPVPESGPRPAAGRARRWWLPRVARWLSELITVFVGVYAAFFLSNHASQRQAHQRRAQLLTWMEDHYKSVLDNSNAQVVVLREKIGVFNAKLTAGEMPEIKPITWQGDYDPSDITSLLQSGGFDLLDIETIRDLRDVESTLRQLVAGAQHAQQRSDALILPNLGKNPSAFYDPATHQLRETYDWLPKVYEGLEEGFEALQASSEKLLAQVRAERARER